MFDEQTIQRFWSKVNKSFGADGCWFRGSERNLEQFYGTFAHKNSIYMAHVVAYEVAHGSVPPDLIVRHLCGRKGCCNPAHLALGTQQENWMDTVFHRKHGRGALAPLQYD